MDDSCDFAHHLANFVFGGFVTSNLIHLILVIALVVFIINLVSGRRAV